MHPVSSWMAWSLEAHIMTKVFFYNHPVCENGYCIPYPLNDSD